MGHLLRTGVGRLALLLITGGIAVATPSNPADAQDAMWSAAPLAFEIPAQSLERALLAYGDATRIQILYDAGLVAAKRSTAVSGRYPPQRALELLLQGTDLRVRYTSPGAITLASVANQPREVMALDVMRVEAAPIMVGRSRRFTGYGETLRDDIITALRRHPVAGEGRYEVTLRVWVDPTGAVIRAELTSSTGQTDQDRAIVEAVAGVGQGRAPPADLPQPISFRFHARPPG